MANWISSKLKVAENLLHQIDQQAAESLRKNERLRSDELNIDDAPAKSGSSVSLKNQLKKKKSPDNNNDYHGKLHSDPNVNVLKTTTTAPKSNPSPTLIDADWTELLSSPNQSLASASNPNHSNGVPVTRGLNRNNSRKQKSLSSVSLVSDVRRNPKSGSRSLQKLNSVKEVKLSGKSSSDDGNNSISTSSGSTERHSNVESETDANVSAEKLVVETNDKEREEDDFIFNYRDRSPQEDLQEENRSLAAETMPVSVVDKVHEAKMAGDVGRGQLRSAISRNELNAVSRNSTSDDLKRVSSIPSNGSSVSDTDSGSSSDSESEREKEERRKKRERFLAEKAAAKAINATPSVPFY